MAALRTTVLTIAGAGATFAVSTAVPAAGRVRAGALVSAVITLGVDRATGV